ncbi:hypothetical protein PAXY110619_26245 [Paenibacillus xylanexedens]|uniref:Uncharacterized protein n=1 Tax=Paenibacillus xylanexedens TaxID=528191 RepID=A0ABS4S1X2_PAEXY|nr:hypothetical protein [Paenibacillus xylanexedens]
MAEMVEAVEIRAAEDHKQQVLIHTTDTEKPASKWTQALFVFITLIPLEFGFNGPGNFVIDSPYTGICFVYRR